MQQKQNPNSYRMPERFVRRRKALRAIQLKQEGALRTIWRRISSQLTRQNASYMRIHGKDYVLTLSERASFKAYLQRAISHAANNTFSLIKSAMREAIRLELKMVTLQYNISLEDIDINKVQYALRDKLLAKPFPGTDLTLQQRIRAYAGKAMLNIAPYIDLETQAERDSAMKVIRKQMSYAKPGSAGVPGGTISKDIARLNRTEQARAVREADLLAYKVADLDFLHWRLGPGHNWEDGLEICEKLAAGMGAGVETELIEAGIDTSTVDLEGLYNAAAFPAIPHPNCICSAVPIVFEKHNQNK
jgi:hypothetical protein